MAELLASIRKREPQYLLGSWVISKGAYGYGEAVCAIEDNLANSEAVEFDGEALFPLLEKGDEYFYSVRMSKNDGSIELGLFDSSYLSMKGPIEVLKSIAKDFQEVELAES